MGKAQKLLEKMQRSKADLGYNDLKALYLGFGFDFREGGNHTMFFHPKFKGLCATVARHNTLAVGYIHTAIKNIKELKRLQKADEGPNERNI